jgi:cytoskeletal protein RodZ
MLKYLHMPQILTRTPLLLGLAALLITGLVFAQVLPEEPVMPEAEEAVAEEAPVATSTPEVTPETASSTATSTAINTEPIVPINELTFEATTTPTPDPVPTVEEFSESIDEVMPLTPEDCHSPEARAFFQNPGECMRGMR